MIKKLLLVTSLLIPAIVILPISMFVGVCIALYSVWLLCSREGHEFELAAIVAVFPIMMLLKVVFSDK